MWGVRVGYMLMCKPKVEGKKVNPSSHLFPLTIIQMENDTSPPKPTRASLFSEGLAVQTLTEAETLRKKFMKQHQQGVKAWNNFVESVEAARVTMFKRVK